jgi:hypothetical protein
MPVALALFASLDMFVRLAVAEKLAPQRVPHSTSGMNRDPYSYRITKLIHPGDLCVFLALDGDRGIG